MVNDKADKEKNIEEIKEEHEREKKGIEEVHEKIIQNIISEFECKERDAQIELQKVRVELTTALLEKEMALSQLREKYYIKEKAKMELKILLEKEKTCTACSRGNKACQYLT